MDIFEKIDAPTFHDFAESDAEDQSIDLDFFGAERARLSVYQPGMTPSKRFSMVGSRGNSRLSMVFGAENPIPTNDSEEKEQEQEEQEQESEGEQPTQETSNQQEDSDQQEDSNQQEYKEKREEEQDKDCLMVVGTSVDVKRHSAILEYIQNRKSQSPEKNCFVVHTISNEETNKDKHGSVTINDCEDSSVAEPQEVYTGCRQMKTQNTDSDCVESNEELSEIALDSQKVTFQDEFNHSTPTVDKNTQRLDLSATQDKLTPYKATSNQEFCTPCTISIPVATPRNFQDSVRRSERISMLMRPTASWVARTSEQGIGQSKKRSSNDNAGNIRPSKSAKIPKLTVPCSPKFATKKLHRDSSSRKSSTTIELEKIQKERILLRKQLSQNRKRASFVSRSRPPILPVRSTKPLTEPIPFNFRTTQRSNFGVDAKNSVDSKAEEKKEFVPKLTDPVPFKFATDERIGCTSSTDNCAGFVSLKQKIESFCVRESHPTSENSTKNHALTSPKPFNLSKSRDRPKLQSTEEKEEEFIKQIKPFKARQVDPRVLCSSGDFGVPKVAKRPLTIPEEFHLHTEERIGRSSHIPEPEVHVFKARKLNEEILHGPTFVPKKQKVELTKPLSPKLSTKERAELHQKPNTSEQIVPFKARLFPVTEPFQPKPSNKPLTVPEPFHLESLFRHEQFIEKHTEELNEQSRIEEEKRKFHARPLPASSPMPYPRPSLKVTSPEPFKLRSLHRHEEAVSQFQQKIQEEEETAARAREFHSKPLPQSDLCFIVKKSTKPLTEVEDFELNSTVRAEQRRRFDEENEIRLEEMEKLHKALLHKKKAEEEEEVKELRKTLVFKARPVQIASPLQPKPSEKPLTEPHSPKLNTTLRSSMRKTGKENEKPQFV